MSKKNTNRILISLLLILAVGLAGFFALRSTNNPSGRTVLYTTTDSFVGGDCGYISFTSKGTRTKKCIDEESAEKAIKKLESANPDIDTSNQNNLMKIEADVHTVIESRSGATEIPEPNDVPVIHIDKIYDVSITNTKYDNY